MFSKIKDCPSNSKNYDPNNHPNSNGKYYSDIRTDEYCVECACNLHLKTRSLSSDCPLRKWKAELTNKEEEEMKKFINDSTNSSDNINNSINS